MGVLTVERPVERVETVVPERTFEVIRIAPVVPIEAPVLAPPPPPNRFAKAAEVLRNTKLPQTRATLHDDHGYCAMGALAKEAGYSDYLIDRMRGKNAYGTERLGDRYGLSKFDRIWIGRLNDGGYTRDPLTFAEIADALEQRGRELDQKGA